MSINAGVILTDEEVRQLTEAGCDIYPRQRIEVDKNAHLRRDYDHVSVPAKYKSRLVGRGNFETTDGLRTDSPAGDVDSCNVVCSCCAQAHVFIRECDFTNGYFQEQETDGILLHRIPAEGVPQEGIAGEAILASHVPVSGNEDAGRGLCVASIEEHRQRVQCSLNQILPTLFTLRNEESKIVAVMSSNTDDISRKEPRP